jgi:DNA replication and repair protein RecF
VYLRHLSVADFRSWPSVELDLDTGPTALVGPNGQGKTNLLEAIGYLATLGSHRAAGDAALVRAGAQRAVVRAAVVAGGRELRPEIELVPGKSNRARLGGTALPRARDLLGAVRTVLFAPEDLTVVRGDPGERRRFLDELLIARRPRLAGVRADYERVLKQRAALLKTAASARRAGGAELATLDVWDGHLAQHGAELLRARLETVLELQPHVAAAHAQVAPDAPPLSMTYVSQTPAAVVTPESLASVAELRDSLLDQLARLRAAELERGVNLAGPHRDDVELRLADLPVRGYASQGESWSVALALRLGSYELLRADDLPGGDPVLLLDDVFAQLDGQRREQLARVAAKAEQALVTAAVAADVPADLSDARYRVADGQVSRDD